MAAASNSTDLSQRLALSEIDDATRAILRLYKPKLMARLPVIMIAFYDHIGQFPALSRFFPSHSHAAHASDLQRAHWSLLLEANFDDQYIASAKRIGSVHCRLGLEPRWYIGAYSHVLSALFGAVQNLASSRWPRLKQGRESHALVRALNKVALLDMDIALSSYFEAAQQSRVDLLSSLAGTFEDRIAQLVRSLNGAVAELSSSARKQAGAAEDARAQAETVSQSAEDATGIIHDVSRGAAILAEALRSVASRIHQSSSVLARAVEEAEAIRSHVSSLGASLGRIDSSVDLIQDVAERTRLLALNAAIEAARAGAAGRGFSVVAAEVQQLAVQTAHATTNIKAGIEHITSSTRQVGRSVEKITATTNEMRDIDASILASIEEHGASAIEMAHHVEGGARVSSQIAQSIGAVSRLVERISIEASTTFGAITDLGRLTSQIDSGVDSFLNSILISQTTIK